MKINEEIKSIRKNLRMTQDEFAAVVGITKNQLAKYESDKDYGVIPQADIYLKIKDLDK